MRTWLLFAATIAVATPGFAQNTAIKQNPGIISPVAKGRPGGSLAGLTRNALTVHYPDQPGINVALITKPALTFTCKVAAGGGYPDKVCTASTPFQTVELRAGWSKDAKVAVGIPATMIAGTQWEGDCKGTQGDTCVLAMNQPRNVQINFNGGTLGLGIGVATDQNN